MAFIITLTLLVHWVQFKLWKMPLPIERTSIFLVPLMTTFVGAIFSIPASRPIERVARRFGLAVLLLIGLHFIGELRDSYFRLWKAGADAKLAYPVIVDLCNRSGVREIATDFHLEPSLSFYQSLYKKGAIDAFQYFDEMPPKKAVYALVQAKYTDFVRDQGLRVVWRGPVSDMVIAVRPGTPGLDIVATHDLP